MTTVTFDTFEDIVDTGEPRSRPDYTLSSHRSLRRFGLPLAVAAAVLAGPATSGTTMLAKEHGINWQSTDMGPGIRNNLNATAYQAGTIILMNAVRLGGTQFQLGQDGTSVTLDNWDRVKSQPQIPRANIGLTYRPDTRELVLSEGLAIPDNSMSISVSYTLNGESAKIMNEAAKNPASLKPEKFYEAFQDESDQTLRYSNVIGDPNYLSAAQNYVSVYKNTLRAKGQLSTISLVALAEQPVTVANYTADAQFTVNALQPFIQ